MDIEQDKRHMATAMVFLGGMMLVATIIMFVLAAVKPQTFNNINGGQTDRIAKVASDWKRPDNDETLELVSVFEKAKYTSYRGWKPQHRNSPAAGWIQASVSGAL